MMSKVNLGKMVILQMKQDEIKNIKAVDKETNSNLHIKKIIQVYIIIQLMINKAMKIIGKLVIIAG